MFRDFYGEFRIVSQLSVDYAPSDGRLHSYRCIFAFVATSPIFQIQIAHRCVPLPGSKNLLLLSELYDWSVGPAITLDVSRGQEMDENVFFLLFIKVRGEMECNSKSMQKKHQIWVSITIYLRNTTQLRRAQR